jgi:hypothetical protein
MGWALGGCITNSSGHRATDFKNVSQAERMFSGDNGDIGTQYEAGTGFIRNPKPFYVLLQNRD